jgi:transcriptional regulator with XRE-family HTH domain
MRDTLNNQLRLWRVRQGLTIEEVADLAGLSPAMVSRVERGERQLAPLTKARVARCLGVSIRELFPVAEEADEDSLDPVTRDHEVAR